jgi:hypothetical protein
MKKLILLASLLAGCGDVSLAALTPPPPGKIATLDDEHDTLELSKGIAFAFECTSSEDSYQGPCRDATATAGDEAIINVFPGYIDKLVDTYDDGYAGPRSRTAFVVVGLAAGVTDLVVKTSDGDVTVEVTVR